MKVIRSLIRRVADPVLARRNDTLLASLRITRAKLRGSRTALAEAIAARNDAVRALCDEQGAHRATSKSSRAQHLAVKDVYARQVHDLELRLAAALERAAEKEQQAEAEASRANELSIANDQLVAVLNEAERHNADLNGQLAGVDRAADTTAQQLQRIQATVTQLEGRLADKTAAIEGLETQADRDRETIRQLEYRATELARANTGLIAELCALGAKPAEAMS